MGRPRKPTEIKKLHGTLEKSRLIPNEIVLMDDFFLSAPNIPEDFNEFEKNEWNGIWSFLIKYKIATNVDLSIIIAYCKEMGCYHECKKMIAEQGKVFKSPSGFPMPSPYLSIGNKSLLNALKIASEYGFTAASRTKITMNVPKTNKLKELLEKSGT